MISKIKQTTSTGNAVRYALRREQAEIIGGTIAATDPNEIAIEFRLSEDLANQQVKRPGYHLMLSYPHSECPNSELMAEIAEKHFAGMALSGDSPESLDETNELIYQAQIQNWLDTESANYQYIIVSHSDKDHAHTHLIASRINLDSGKAIPTYRERYRSQMVTRQLEREYNLQQQESSWEINKKRNRDKKANQVDRLEQINQEQSARVAQIIPLIKELQNRHITTWGKTKQYELGGEGDRPILYRSGQQLIDWDDDQPISLGIQQSDLEATRQALEAKQSQKQTQPKAQKQDLER